MEDKPILWQQSNDEFGFVSEVISEDEAKQLLIASGFGGSLHIPQMQVNACRSGSVRLKDGTFVFYMPKEN